MLEYQGRLKLPGWRFDAKKKRTISIRDPAFSHIKPHFIIFQPHDFSHLSTPPITCGYPLSIG